jgi:hypothetical protein
VKDSQGQVVNRAVRTYDTQGRVIEEKQILDQPEMMFPPEIRAKLVQESGLCEEELVRELRGKITELMGGKSDPYSVSYTYDSLGRIVHTRRRMFNREKEIDSSYNDQGDMVSEITRETTSSDDRATSTVTPPTYSEVRFSYRYDDRQNWTEKTVEYRSTPDGAFQGSRVVKRTLTYY